jgi:CubicO group peptidase (beta-lactamase class C family)
LPQYRFANEITIHQLLAHRSGVPTYDRNLKLNNASWFNNEIITDEFIAEYCSDMLEFEPGSKMS